MEEKALPDGEWEREVGEGGVQRMVMAAVKFAL